MIWLTLISRRKSVFVQQMPLICSRCGRSTRRELEHQSHTHTHTSLVGSRSQTGRNKLWKGPRSRYLVLALALVWTQKESDSAPPTLYVLRKPNGHSRYLWPSSGSWLSEPYINHDISKLLLEFNNQAKAFQIHVYCLKLL